MSRGSGIGTGGLHMRLSGREGMPVSKAESRAWRMLMDNPHIGADTIQVLTGLLPEEIEHLRGRIVWLKRQGTEETDHGNHRP